jgi:hypothetical protein
MTLRCGTLMIDKVINRYVVYGRRRYGTYRTVEMARYRRFQVERSSRPRKETV